MLEKMLKKKKNHKLAEMLQIKQFKHYKTPYIFDDFIFPRPSPHLHMEAVRRFDTTGFCA